MSADTKGKKFDEGKPDLSLIPLSALKEEAKGFMYGAQVYGRYNYTKGMEASRLVAAALRHIAAWNEGEDTDAESGASHLGHARCCMAMLLECMRLGTLIDDRLGKPADMGQYQIQVTSNNLPEDAPTTEDLRSNPSGWNWEPRTQKYVRRNPLDYIK